MKDSRDKPENDGGLFKIPDQVGDDEMGPGMTKKDLLQEAFGDL